MISRPPNWYEMSWDQQRDWETNSRRQQSEMDDLERAREDEEHSRKAAQAEARELWSRHQSTVGELQGIIDDLSGQLDNANAEMKLRDDFLAAWKLQTTFDDWASYRRTE